MAFCIYARKSTESNDRQVLSIEAQVNELKQVARKDKLKIAKVCIPNHNQQRVPGGLSSIP